MLIIQSLKNEKVKHWKKLQTRKERDAKGLFIAEGEHLIDEAHKAGLIKELIATESYLPKLPKSKYGQYNLYVVTNDIGKTISDTETPQGILAVCKKMEYAEIAGTRFLLIDAVQDPGNLGTMIRTADAAGLDAVIVGKGSADIYSPKVIRASQGSHFHLPIISADLPEWIQKLSEKEIPVYGTALKNGDSMHRVASGGKFALIVGNEGSGVEPELLQKTVRNLYIPIYGKSESLNVSVATGILLYYLRGGNQT